MAQIGNSNLPSIQRVKYEDYKDAPSWFGQFLNTLNLFLTAMYNIINRGITYANLGVIAPYSFVYTPGSTKNFTFSNPLIVAPNVVLVGNVYENGDLTAHPAAMPSLFWHYSKGTIYIDAIAGLVTGTSYVITVLVA